MERERERERERLLDLEKPRSRPFFSRTVFAQNLEIWREKEKERLLSSKFCRKISAKSRDTNSEISRYEAVLGQLSKNGFVSRDFV